MERFREAINLWAGGVIYLGCRGYDIGLMNTFRKRVKRGVQPSPPEGTERALNLRQILPIIGAYCGPPDGALCGNAFVSLGARRYSLALLYV